MTFPGRVMSQGTFTVPTLSPATTGTAVVNVNTGFVPTRIELINLTRMADNTQAFIQRASWNQQMANAGITGMIEYITSPAATTLNIASVTNNRGILTYDYSAASPNSNLLSASLGGGGTTINLNANATFTTTGAHGLQVGDTIQISNNALMTNISGLQFTVSAVPTVNTFQVDLNTSNITAFPLQETSYIVRKVTVGPLYYPQRIVITNITQANPMVISTSQNHGLTVGQKVRILVPSVWGMTNANNLIGTITAVTNATGGGTPASITIGGIDSSAFNAFVFAPPSRVPFTFAQVVPIGAGPSAVTFGNVTYNVDQLDDATLNQGFQGFTVGADVLVGTAGGIPTTIVYRTAAADVYAWTAWRADQ